MMNDIITPFQIYWLTRCDDIKEFFSFCPAMVALFIICGIASIMTLCGAMAIKNECGSGENEYEPVFMKTAKITGISSITLMILLTLFDLVSVFIPSTKEMAAIVVVPRVANSQSVQSLGEGIVDLAKQWMVELSPDSVKNKPTEGNATDKTP